MARIIRIAFFALVLLQPAWHGWLHPPKELSPGWVVLLALLPLLPPLAGLLMQRGSAPFWAGLLALPYLCHGIAEAWASPPQRLLGVAECVLALVVVVAVGLQGLQRRRLARARP